MEQGTVIATLNIDHEYRRQLYEDNEWDFECYKDDQAIGMGDIFLWLHREVVKSRVQLDYTIHLPHSV
jgi:hypothetical protein